MLRGSGSSPNSLRAQRQRRPATRPERHSRQLLQRPANRIPGLGRDRAEDLTPKPTRKTSCANSLRSLHTETVTEITGASSPRCLRPTRQPSALFICSNPTLQFKAHAHAYFFDSRSFGATRNLFQVPAHRSQQACGKLPTPYTQRFLLLFGPIAQAGRAGPGVKWGQESPQDTFHAGSEATSRSGESVHQRCDPYWIKMRIGQLLLPSPRTCWRINPCPVPHRTVRGLAWGPRSMQGLRERTKKEDAHPTGGGVCLSWLG